MIRNLTSLPITLIVEGAPRQTFAPAGPVAKVWRHFAEAGGVDGVPVIACVDSGTVGLPREVHGMFFIVERDVAEANPARRDLLVAAVPVADITGQTKGIIGYTTFESYGPKSEDLVFYTKNTGSWTVDSKTSNIPR
jgi:hypothetical protein